MTKPNPDKILEQIQKAKQLCILLEQAIHDTGDWESRSLDLACTKTGEITKLLHIAKQTLTYQVEKGQVEEQT